MAQYVYPSSGSVKVFPTTKRGDQQRSARFITEKNIVNLVNNLLDKDSFIITKKVSNDFDIATENLEFNIGGYYFKVDEIDTIISNLISGIQPQIGDCVWANIFTYYTGEYEELYGYDEVVTINEESLSVYKGLTFSYGLDGIGSAKSLKILECVGFKDVDGANIPVWSIPDDSLLKYSFDRIFDLDCGVI